MDSRINVDEDFWSDLNSQPCSDVWADLLLCEALLGHSLPRLLQLQGCQDQERQGVSIDCQEIDFSQFDHIHIPGMSSG